MCRFLFIGKWGRLFEPRRLKGTKKKAQITLNNDLHLRPLMPLAPQIKVMRRPPSLAIRTGNTDPSFAHSLFLKTLNSFLKQLPPDAMRHDFTSLWIKEVF
jgi:hypothetical protein